jgi:hypothetical protein
MITHMMGTIDRRLLVSYRIDPAVAATQVPAPFRPAVRDGSAIGGICLIRLSGLRPRWLRGGPGLLSENVAHRFAVEWDGRSGPKRGVFVPRRDTSSRLATFAGGRAFPGPMHHGRFLVDEESRRFDVEYASDDGAIRITLCSTEVDNLPSASTFTTLASASEFFRQDSIGWSPPLATGACESVELQTLDWNVAPLELESVRSSFFDDRKRFPAGSIELDCGLVMRSINADWVARPGARP